ncbi:MAG: radical SAM protein [Pseudomonadota bacterium]|nr:radical SAM protein [Pseudomonadota bacterium]
MAKRLLIIQPSHYRSRSERTVVRIGKRKVVPLTLPYLAALTPPDWDVTLVDEQLDGIDFSAPADLVAITVWTINSLRAYDVADRFRRRGLPVIMGGPHMSFHGEEAAEHCDAVGVGEGEGIWRQMLADGENGRLRKFYRSDRLCDLQGLPTPRYELLNMGGYGYFKTFSVQSSRGCPFKCEFCSERLYLGSQYRRRPVAEVVEEIGRCGSRYILFADSNFAGRVENAMRLMEALIPLKLRWSALWSLRLCADGEFLDLAQRSGLLHVNIGIESISADALTEMNKKTNIVDTEKILGDLRRRGISYSLNFIFGADADREDIFPATLSFLMRNKAPAAYLNILTPHKGSALYDRLAAENRIIDSEGIGRWPGMSCHIKHPHFSPDALLRHVQELHNAFYSYRSMLARLPLPLTRSAIASWIVNFSERNSFRIGAENFSDY